MHEPAPRLSPWSASRPDRTHHDPQGRPDSHADRDTCPGPNQQSDAQPKACPQD